MPDNHLNSALTVELVHTIGELQSLYSLNSFALAGGTSLALRFNHRRSIDIDLFSNQMVGLAGLVAIQSELEQFYKSGLINCEIIDPGQGEQYCFLRAFVSKKKGLIIKIEIIQNVPLLDPFESLAGIRIISQRDIALLKLMSASNRRARKDIYDLDFLTDRIPLGDLVAMLKEKEAMFNAEQFKCLFDLDHEQSPVNDIGLLLAFDQTNYRTMLARPNHSNDIIDIVVPSKNWISAKISWRMKVVTLMRSWGMTPPPVKPVN